MKIRNRDLLIVYKAFEVLKLILRKSQTFYSTVHEHNNESAFLFNSIPVLLPNVEQFHSFILMIHFKIISAEFPIFRLAEKFVKVF